MALTKVTERIISDNLSISGIATASNFKTGTTNVHNVGVEVAGINVLGGDTPIGTGSTIWKDGDTTLAGVVTATSFVGDITGSVTGKVTGDLNSTGFTTVTNFDTKGTLVEAFKTHTTAWNSAGNLNISEGNLHYNSTNLGGTGAFLNVISTAGINTDLATGQALNVTAITSVNATTAFVNALKIDGKGTGITTSWVGGTVPTDGGGSGVDTYSFNILKTGSETYVVVASQTKTS